MRKVFISYARSDYDKALELYNYLSDQGLMPWMDKKDLLPGQEWKREIERAIRESDVFVACMSNLSVNKKGFVQAELRKALSFAEEMPEGEIYIIPVRFDDCDVPSSLSKYHWVDYFQVDEREKITKAILSHSGQIRAASQTQEMYYNAGERVQSVREELDLSTGEFFELLDPSGQSDYEDIEESKKDTPLSLLEKVSRVSGVNLTWLKHGQGYKYNVGSIKLRSVEEDLQYCASLNPRNYFLTLNTDNWHAGLVIQRGNYKYEAVETGITLDFWNWVDSHWKIPAFFNFLKRLSGEWYHIAGVSLQQMYDDQLFNGEIHFLAARRFGSRNADSLVYDLLDIDNTRQTIYGYSKTYHDDWMNKVHDVFRKYRDDGQIEF